jgi:hypothetical protein
MSSIYDKSSLVLIPSGTKVSKVYSQKPVSGDGDFTFTRSSAATRVDADGNIEKETSNLLLQSNSFDTTWTSSGTTETGSQTGYDGSSDAWEISKGASQYRRIAQSISSSGVQTLSVYAKANTQDVISFLCSSTSGDAGGVFNLSTETWVTNFNTIDFGSESIGNGWHRVYVTFNRNIVDVRIYVGWSDSDAGSIYIQDAQLEQGLVARDYIETTTSAVYGGITDNVPRLDYTDSSCPALLLEPQRTNSIISSEYIDSWSKNEFSINTNSATSPEGVVNASKIIPSTNNIEHYIDRLGFNRTANQYIAHSIYVKPDGYNYFSLSNAANRLIANFELIGEGSARYVSSNGTDFTNHSASIESVGNGWYRCTLIGQALNSVASYMRISCGSSAYNSSAWSGAGDGTSGVLVYGAQVELNSSYATSYIPTYGSSVTRTADTGQVMNLDTNNIVGASQWTFFAELEVHNNTASSDKMALTDADSMPRTYLYNTALGWAGGWIGSSYNLPLNTNSKVAWRLNDSRNGNIFANGELRATISNQSVDMTADRIFLRGAQGKWRLRQIILFPIALTDQELIDLTTL